MTASRWLRVGGVGAARWLRGGVAVRQRRVRPASAASARASRICARKRASPWRPRAAAASLSLAHFQTPSRIAVGVCGYGVAKSVWLRVWHRLPHPSAPLSAPLSPPGRSPLGEHASDPPSHRPAQHSQPCPHQFHSRCAFWPLRTPKSLLHCKLRKMSDCSEDDEDGDEYDDEYENEFLDSSSDESDDEVHEYGAESDEQREQIRQWKERLIASAEEIVDAPPFVRNNKKAMMAVLRGVSYSQVIYSTHLLALTPESLRIWAGISDQLKADAKFVQKACGISLRFLTHVAEPLRSNQRFMLWMINRWGELADAFPYLPVEFRADEAIVMAATRRNAGNFVHSAPEIRNKKSVVMALVQRSSWYLAHIPEKWHADREVMLACIRGDEPTEALAYVTGDSQNDEELALEAVRRDGGELRHCSEYLRSIRSVVVAAVEHHGQALQYASDTLRDDEAVVLAAVAEDAFALKWASPRLKKDHNIVRRAIESQPTALVCADNAIRADAKFVRHAITLAAKSAPRPKLKIDDVIRNALCGNCKQPGVMPEWWPFEWEESNLSCTIFQPSEYGWPVSSLLQDREFMIWLCKLPSLPARTCMLLMSCLPASSLECDAEAVVPLVAKNPEALERAHLKWRMLRGWPAIPGMLPEEWVQNWIDTEKNKNANEYGLPEEWTTRGMSCRLWSSSVSFFKHEYYLESRYMRRLVRRVSLPPRAQAFIKSVRTWFAEQVEYNVHLYLIARSGDEPDDKKRAYIQTLMEASTRWGRNALKRRREEGEAICELSERIRKG